jgi:hypothetical protein
MPNEELIKLEGKLDIAADRLLNATRRVETVEKKLTKLLEGDETTPGIVSRVISTEDFIKTARWTIGILYAAIISIILKIITERI